MSARGEIWNRERKRQIIDMRGMAFGTITPTDLDGLIEYHNDRFVFFELKLQGTPVGVGQGLALRNIVNAIERGGKAAVLFVAEHDVHNTERDVEAHLCRVRDVYTRQRWWTSPYQGMTLREACDRFLGFASQLPDGQIVSGEAQRTCETWRIPNR